MVVGSGDELVGRAGRGLLIGSMTNDGVCATEISYRIGGGADVRRSIVHPASGATRMNPIAIKAIQRSGPRSGRVNRWMRSVR
jgi:hypothetical protein